MGTFLVMAILLTTLYPRIDGDALKPINQWGSFQEMVPVCADYSLFYFGTPVCTYGGMLAVIRCFS